MVHDAKVTSKGQITLPAKLREALGIAPGDYVEFIERSDGTVSVAKKTGSFSDLKGIVKLVEPVTTEQINAWIAQARGAIGTRS